MGSEPAPRRDPAAGSGDTDAWNLAVRDEQPEQRADRNFQELLQELRVMQTGVQILFALLLTVTMSDLTCDGTGIRSVAPE